MDAFPALSSTLDGASTLPSGGAQPTSNGGPSSPAVKTVAGREAPLASKDPRVQARTLARTLAEDLQKTNQREKLDWASLQPLFIRIKNATRKLECLRDDDDAPALSRLASQLKVALEKLWRHCQGKALDVDHLDIHGVRACTNLLAAAIGDSRNGGLLGAKRGQCRDELAGLNKLLVARALACGLPGNLAANGVLLDILNAQRRGLDARTFEVTGPMRELAERALDVMESWPVADGKSLPMTDAGKLVPRQLGKTMVQLKMFIDKGLLSKEAFGSRVAALALKLCNEHALNEMRLHEADAGPGPEHGPREREDDAQSYGVQLTNISNTLKDFLDPGLALLKPGDPGLSAVAARLCELMPQIPAQGLGKRGWQTLSNCANFLRTLCEMALAGTPVLPADDARYERACEWAMHCVVELDASGLSGSAQSVSNLASFVKAIDKEDRRPLTPVQSCAAAIVEQAGPLLDSVGAQDLVGLLPALAWFRQRGLLANKDRRAALEASITRLLQRVKDDLSGRLQVHGSDGVPRALLLLLGDADEGPLQQLTNETAHALLKRGWAGGDKRAWLLLAERIVEGNPALLQGLQDALRPLLAWRASRPISLDDISQAIAQCGAKREIVPPLPGQARAEPARQSPIPGDIPLPDKPVVLDWSSSVARAPRPAAQKKVVKKDADEPEAVYEPGVAVVSRTGLRMGASVPAPRSAALGEASRARPKAPAARPAAELSTTAVSNAKRFAILLRSGDDSDLPELAKLHKARPALLREAIQWQGEQCSALLVALARGNAGVAAWLASKDKSIDDAIAVAINEWLSMNLQLGAPQEEILRKLLAPLSKTARKQIRKQLDPVHFSQQAAMARLLQEAGVLALSPPRPAVDHVPLPDAGRASAGKRPGKTAQGSASIKPPLAPERALESADLVAVSLLLSQLNQMAAEADKRDGNEGGRKLEKIRDNSPLAQLATRRIATWDLRENPNLLANAALRGDLEATSYLLLTPRARDELGSADKSGRTPLRIALDERHYDVARLLLDASGALQLMAFANDGLSAAGMLALSGGTALKKAAATKLLAAKPDAPHITIYSHPAASAGVIADLSGVEGRLALDDLPRGSALQRFFDEVLKPEDRPFLKPGYRPFLMPGAKPTTLGKVVLTADLLKQWATGKNAPSGRLVGTNHERIMVVLVPAESGLRTEAGMRSLMAAIADEANDAHLAIVPAKEPQGEGPDQAVSTPGQEEAEEMLTAESAESSSDEVAAAQPGAGDDDSESMETAEWEDSSSSVDEAGEPDLESIAPDEAGAAAARPWRNPAAALIDWLFRKPGGQ